MKLLYGLKLKTIFVDVIFLKPSAIKPWAFAAVFRSWEKKGTAMNK